MDWIRDSAWRFMPLVRDSLAGLCWAPAGKDPGFTPLSLLKLLKRRGRRERPGGWPPEPGDPEDPGSPGPGHGPVGRGRGEPGGAGRG